MTPTYNSYHVDPLLTDVLVGWMQQNPSIAYRMFAAPQVALQGGKFQEYDRGTFNKIVARKRANYTEAAVGGYKVKNRSYFCEPTAVKKPVSLYDINNAQGATDPERDAALWVGQQIKLAQEKDFADAFFQTSVWTTELAGQSGASSGSNLKYWSDPTSTPLEDVELQIAAMQEATGFKPNKFLMGRRVWSKLKNHPEFVERIKFGSDSTTPAIVQLRLLAQLWELDEVMVGDLVENTADEGQTENSQFIFGKHALLTYAPSTPSTTLPSAGYIFKWTGVASNDENAKIARYWEDKIQSWWIEGETAYDMNLVAPDLGCFFHNIVA
jgi:hypothetical protein